MQVHPWVDTVHIAKFSWKLIGVFMSQIQVDPAKTRNCSPLKLRKTANKLIRRFIFNRSSSFCRVSFTTSLISSNYKICWCTFLVHSILGLLFLLFATLNCAFITLFTYENSYLCSLSFLHAFRSSSSFFCHCHRRIHERTTELVMLQEKSLKMTLMMTSASWGMKWQRIK